MSITSPWRMYRTDVVFGLFFSTMRTFEKWSFYATRRRAVLRPYIYSWCRRPPFQTQGEAPSPYSQGCRSNTVLLWLNVFSARLLHWLHLMCSGPRDPGCYEQPTLMPRLNTYSQFYLTSSTRTPLISSFVCFFFSFLTWLIVIITFGRFNSQFLI